jgi:hypothetical protein
VQYADEHAVQPLKKWKGAYAPGGPKAWGARSGQQSGDRGLVFLVLLLGIIIGGVLSLSVVTPERVAMLQRKERLW